MPRCFSGPPRPPTFNITFNLWNVAFLVAPPPGLPFLANVPCQLQLGERTNDQNTNTVEFIVYLLCPALTNISEAPPPMTPFAIVECPAASGRFYQVAWVDDVGKGFANEYRQVWMRKLRPFPYPIP
jgi:hypothetical protein